jgi:hypothetical protein
MHEPPKLTTEEDWCPDPIGGGRELLPQDLRHWTICVILDPFDLLTLFLVIQVSEWCSSGVEVEHPCLWVRIFNNTQVSTAETGCGPPHLHVPIYGDEDDF